MIVSRRGFLIGAASLLAAPAIVRASEIMPVRPLADPGRYWVWSNGQPLSRAIHAQLFSAIPSIAGFPDGTTINWYDSRTHDSGERIACGGREIDLRSGMPTTVHILERT